MIFKNDYNYENDCKIYFYAFTDVFKSRKNQAFLLNKIFLNNL